MSDIRAVKRNISMQRWAAIIADRNTTDLTVKEYCTRNNLVSTPSWVPHK